VNVQGTGTQTIGGRVIQGECLRYRQSDQNRLRSHSVSVQGTGSQIRAGRGHTVRVFKVQVVRPEQAEIPHGECLRYRQSDQSTQRSHSVSVQGTGSQTRTGRGHSV
jgi:hypothetical protein